MSGRGLLDMGLGEKLEAGVQHRQTPVMLAYYSLDHDAAAGVQSRIVAAPEEDHGHRSRTVDDGAFERGDA